MTSTKPQIDWLERILRFFEICMILGTVYLMYGSYQLQLAANNITLEGLKLQEKANKLQNRPYLFIYQERTELNKASDNEYSWTTYIKNTSNYPAVNVRYYVLIMADGVPLHSVNCTSVPSKSNQIQFEKENKCRIIPQTIQVPKQNIQICANTKLPTQAIYPGSETRIVFPIPKRHLNLFKEVRDEAKSGIFFILLYSGLDEETTYISRLVVLPHKDAPQDDLLFKTLSTSSN